MSPFSEWESFYVIIGSSAAGLTGLQFVVIALMADRQTPSTTREIDAFASPTIVHFGVVLLLSGILTAPWHGLTFPALLLGGCGLAGMVYSALVLRRARGQRSYRLVLEDWLFFAVLPLLAYMILAVGAFLLRSHPGRALFGIATTALLLLFIGIHNAWDTVTYIAVMKPGEPARSKQPPPVPPGP
jgi:F0F1-type ATP synthase assembly protein I